MRIAIAHEWLTNWAGSERVAEQMVKATNCHELVSSIVDPALASRYFPGVRVRSLWPSRLPRARTNWSRYAPAMIAAWAAVKIHADLLIVSSHFAAHGATIRHKGPSIVYYHTPARIIWRPDIELARLPHATHSPVRHLALPPLRSWDRFVSRRPTVALANSSAIAKRVSDAYGRSATVLHPPVDVERWRTVERSEGRHLLFFGRLVGYKKPSVAVEAARLSGLPLIIIGDGPERKKLEAHSPSNVTFLGRATESVIREAMASAKALLFPGEEDFGIVPVEALAAGIPIISYAAGGALDYVQHGENGILVPDQEPSSFAAAIALLDEIALNADRIRETATRFDATAFRRGLDRAIRQAISP